MGMEEILLQVLILAYTSTGIVAIIGYAPTIKDLWLKKKKSANTNSYIIWTACSTISVLYSVFVLPNWPFRLVAGANLACCAIILALSLMLELKGKKQASKEKSP